MLNPIMTGSFDESGAGDAIMALLLGQPLNIPPTPRRTEPIVAARKKLKDRGLRDPVPDFPKKVRGESPDDRARKLQDFISGKTQGKHKFTPGMQSRHNLFVV